MLHKGRETPIRIDNGGFVACPAMPGWVDPMSRDHGLGPLAMVVRSSLVPGRIIAMHEHRNDEIISWVPDGVMRHDDRLHGKLVTDAGHLMVMNAGSSFWHSEATLPDDPPLDMLQIFIRPSAADLDPMIQHGPLAPAAPGNWRHIVGPEGGTAPFFVRSAVDIYDIRCREGMEGTFPARPGRDLYFYVFSGAIRAGGKSFAASEQGLLRGGGPLDFTATTGGSIVVAFLADALAAVSKSGTIGDNPRLPPVILFRLFSLWKRLQRRWQG
jgi:redox-sensitive bicupin YhaK (pirin superfamily)